MAYIKQEFIDKVLQDADIIEVFHTYGDPVKKRGVNYFCKSPFTDEKSASCCVNPTTQLFKDFSSGKAGNIWTYIMHKNNCSYVEAIEDLAKKQGKTIEYEHPEIAEKIKVKKEKEQNLRKYLDALLVKFQNKLFELERSHPAWVEIKRRGYSDEDVKDWGLGYAPGNYFMYDLFSEAGNVEAGKKLGLINDANADKLFNKLIYPIRDERGQLTGFASRRLDNNDDYAKWMNPSENELYDKKQTLYGLNIAKNAIVKQNRVWIVEGYNDVIAWHLCGQENTVAVSGTAFTIEQMKKLKKLTSKITLCLDGDAAGQKKVSQYVAKLLELGFAVEVCFLPNDLDPDDYSRIIPPEDVCRKLISDDMNLSKSLQPYITNGFEVFLKEKNKGDELDRTNGIREIIKTISRIPDIALRNLYSERLQKEAKVKPALIKELLREQEAEQVKILNAASEKFVRPYGVTMSFEDIEPLVDKYELFIDNNQIYLQDSYSWPITFESVSNFSIEILQHMNDDKFPKKLLRVCNTDNEERIFDVPANTLNSLQRFEDALTVFCFGVFDNLKSEKYKISYKMRTNKQPEENIILAPLEWYTVKRKVSELIPCDFNPRQISEEELNRLKKSLEKFNLVEIPAADIDNVLLAGHQRIAAMFILGRGEELIDVRIPNRKLTEDEFKEYMLRSNIHNGEFDWSMIEEFFQDIDLEDIGMDLGAFETFLKDNAFVPEEEEGDFDPEPPAEPKTISGDIYELISTQKGIKHVVLCGDSTLPESYQKILSGEKYNLIVTDPPYNVNYEGGTKDKLKIQNDNMSNDEFYSFLYLFYQECFINSELGAPIYIFHADSGR